MRHALEEFVAFAQAEDADVLAFQLRLDDAENRFREQVSVLTIDTPATTPARVFGFVTFDSAGWRRRYNRPSFVAAQSISNSLLFPAERAGRYG